VLKIPPFAKPQTVNTVSAIIPVETNPWGMSVSIDGLNVYVANLNTTKVSVINTATNTVSDTVEVGAGPVGVSVNPNGLYVYVSNSYDNTISVIETATNTVSATIPVGIQPYGVSVSPDGLKLYVANFNDNTVNVINTISNTVTDTITVGLETVSFGNFISTYSMPVGIISQNNKFTNITIYPNPATNTITIETTLRQNTSIQTVIKNTLGQIVYTLNDEAISGLYKKTIDINLGQGIYFLTLQTNQGLMTKRIEIIKYNMALAKAGVQWELQPFVLLINFGAVRQ
jgi:YVTN family beta-propeller protein